jgi:hypothetical protein
VLYIGTRTYHREQVDEDIGSLAQNVVRLATERDEPLEQRVFSAAHDVRELNDEMAGD